MRLSENLSLYLRENLFERIVHAPLSFLDTHSYGDIMSRLTNDSQRVSTVAQVLEEFMSKTIVIIGCAVIMLMKSWKLAMISIVTALVTTIISAIISGHMRNYFMRQTMSLGAMNGHLEESMKNFRTMEMAGTGSYASQKMKGRDEFRVTVSAVWAVLNTLILVTDIRAGYFNPKVFLSLGICVAILFAALWVGNIIFRHINKKWFMIITYVLMGISGLSLLVK
jgi:ATP-binding cassette subfamily B protein